jgi:starch phosphorylase
VGPENIFLFGLKVHEIAELKASGAYRPADLYANDPALRRVLDAFSGDRFSPGFPGRFDWVRRNLVDHGDPYFHLADFAAYREAQVLAGREYREPGEWWRKAIRNVSRTGKFSSDRTIREYAEEIWDLRSVPA